MIDISQSIEVSFASCCMKEEQQVFAVSGVRCDRTYYPAPQQEMQYQEENSFVINTSLALMQHNKETR